MSAIREIEDGSPDPLEHGLLVSLPGAERDSIVLEDRAWAEVRTSTCKRIAMQANGDR